MASRVSIFSLTVLLLSTQITPAAAEEPIAVSKLDYGSGYGHHVESLTFSEGGYGYGPQSSAEPTPSGDDYGHDQSSTEPTPSDNGYGYGPQSSAEPTPSDNGYGYGPQTSAEPISSDQGYQNPTEPATSLLSVSTPGPNYPTAPYSSYGSISPSWLRNCTTKSTVTVTIPYPSPSTSDTYHNATTSAPYAPITTPSVSTSRNCTTKSTTTVTVPWPGTGTGQLPSASGTGGYGQAPYGNGTYQAPSMPGSAPPSATGAVSTWTSSSEPVPEPSSATQPPDAEDTPTPTLPPAEASPVPEPSGNTPPAPPASPTTSGEPLFTGGATKKRNGAGFAVAVGAMMVLL